MTDKVIRLDLLRSFYRAESRLKGNDNLELKDIANELKIANDLKASDDDAEISNATGSPYLQDQRFQRKNVLFGSAEETDWKTVKSYEETRNKTLVFTNLKKLNIL